MVFGNRDAHSGTGVAFSRNPATGAPGAYGDFLVHAQGQDVVDGDSRTEDLDDLQHRFPDAHAEFVAILDRLEAHYQDLCETEFTIESGRLWMLQTRSGKRTTAAAVRIAVDMAEQDGWRLGRDEAVRRVRPEDLDHLSRSTLGGGGDVLTTGLPASPGAATGRVYLSAEACVEAVDRGEQVLLVRAETSPEDVHGMQVAEGILTARGGLVSHAAVVARGWGIPAVVGVEAMIFDGGEVTIGSVVVREGDVLSIDGTTGEIRLGAATWIEGAALPELETLLAWADEFSGESPDARSPGERLLAAHAALIRPQS
jgi:pyruvate,orthophosphate dikinase